MARLAVIELALLLFAGNGSLASCQSAATTTEAITTTKDLIHKLYSVPGVARTGVVIKLAAVCSVKPGEHFSAPTTVESPTLLAAGILTPPNVELESPSTFEMNLRPLEWKTVSQSLPPSQAISAALATNSRITVSLLNPQVIRIEDSGLSSRPLLHARIRQLKLTKEERHAPEMALEKAFSSKEVQEAAERLRLEGFIRTGGILDIRHEQLGRSLKAATLNDVIVAILSKFGGFFLYQECADRQNHTYFDWEYVSPHHSNL